MDAPTKERVDHLDWTIYLLMQARGGLAVMGAELAKFPEGVAHGDQVLAIAERIGGQIGQLQKQREALLPYAEGIAAEVDSPEAEA